MDYCHWNSEKKGREVAVDNIISSRFWRQLRVTALYECLVIPETFLKPLYA